MVLYPGGVSDTEMMLAYGCCHFGSKAGELAGNHFLTITEGKEKLMDIGREILYNGAETVEISILYIYRKGRCILHRSFGLFKMLMYVHIQKHVRRIVR